MCLFLFLFKSNNEYFTVMSSNEIVQNLSAVYNNGKITSNNIKILETADLKNLLVNQKNFNAYINDLEKKIVNLKNDLENKIAKKANKIKPIFRGPLTVNIGEDNDRKDFVSIKLNNKSNNYLMNYIQFYYKDVFKRRLGVDNSVGFLHSTATDNNHVN